jgi:hypothetical protein
MSDHRSGANRWPVLNRPGHRGSILFDETGTTGVVVDRLRRGRRENLRETGDPGCRRKHGGYGYCRSLPDRQAEGTLPQPQGGIRVPIHHLHPNVFKAYPTASDSPLLTDLPPGQRRTFGHGLAAVLELGFKTKPFCPTFGPL